MEDTSSLPPLNYTVSSVHFSRAVMSDSLWPHGLQHASLPCPSLSPGVCSNSCPLSWWCHPTSSSSVVPFSSCLQCFPASGSFPVSQLFASGGRIIGASASASVLSVNIQDWFPLGFSKTFIFITRAYLSCQNKKSRLLGVFIWHTVLKVKVLVAQSCPTLCNP